MVRFVLALWFMTSLGPAQSLPVQSEVAAGLARAETLYYEAKFRESIDVLLPLDSALQPQSGRLPDKISVKLQLALNHIGLNETGDAKRFFAELSALDAGYSLDPQQFSPKVITLFEEARAERDQARCQTFCTEIENRLETGNTGALDLSGQTPESQCSCIDEFALDLADVFYKQAVEAYKQDLLPEALQKFRTALKFQPEHEFASQYIELTQNKAKLAADQLLLDWRKNFDARLYPVAADRYRKLVTLNLEGEANPALDEIRQEYARALSPLLESWNRACQANDAATMNSVRQQTEELLPEPAIGQDALTQMTTCAQKGCIPMESQLATSRLRTRVDPVITPVMRDFVLRNTASLLLQVRVRIDESGDTTVTQLEGGYPIIDEAVKTAVQAWKFIPAIVEGEPRCVDTVLPILIRR
jgi:hypothetical protein